MGDGHRKKSPYKALMHPLRVNLLLRIIHAGLTSPNLLSKELDENLNVVAYHIRILEDYGAIILIETKQRRGAHEHFYSADPDSGIVTLLLGQQLSVAPQSVPGDFLRRLLELRKESKVTIASAIPVLIDPEGLKEVRAAASVLTKTIKAAEGAAKARAARSKIELSFLTFGLLAFPLLDESDENKADRT